MSMSTVGPWAKDKLLRLEKYLNAYTTIMRAPRQQRWCKGFHYIDAFAGPGRHEVRKNEPPAQTAMIDMANFGQEQEEQIEFLKGSPRVALDLQHPFTTYAFVEMNPARVQSLEHLKVEYQGKRIAIHSGDCSRFLLDNVANNPRADWKGHRAIVFLDPFGMQVEWSTVEALAKTKAIEIFLNFPVGMAIQRQLPRDPAKLTAALRSRLDRYFGSPDWYGKLYQSTRTLFGDEDEKINNSGEALLIWYRGRLKSAFGHTSKAALIRNTRGSHLYYLLLATPNPTGAEIADHILSAGEYV